MSKAGLPKSIRIGCFDYAIEDWPPNEASAAQKLGECDKHNNVIRVRTNMPAQRVAETLWHEILHAIWDTGACHSDDEEKIVSIMAAMQCQVWRDNPELIAFMDQMVHPTRERE